jgi:hypothetical protein
MSDPAMGRSQSPINRVRPRPSVLDPPFTFEREGSDPKEVDVPLDVVPIPAVCSSQDSRVFLLAYLPPSGLACDDEPMNVFLVDQAAID